MRPQKQGRNTVTPTSLAKSQVAKLVKTFKSEVVASLGVRSSNVCSKMSPLDGRRPSRSMR